MRGSVYALDAPRLTICPHTDDDGEKETRVLEEYIKAEDAGSSDEERKRDDGDRGRGRMRVGDRIEAKYRGRSKYYKGKISRVRADGTFDVAYVLLGARNYFGGPSLTVAHTGRWRIRDARRGAPHPLARRRWSR